MPFCEGCGSSLEDTFNYCPSCGRAKVFKPVQQKIEYRDEKIKLDFKWKGHFSTDIIDSMPSNLKEKANKLIYEKVKELGEDGWEPLEKKFDITSLIRFITSSKLYGTSKRVGLLTCEEYVEYIVVKFKRTIMQ